MKQLMFFLLAGTLMMVSCQSKTEKTPDFEGSWLIELDIAPDVLPFTMSIQKSGEKWKAEILNADEVLSYDDISFRNDSIIIPMGIFDSEIRAAINAEGLLKGVFAKNFSSIYEIPLSGKREFSTRFAVSSEPTANFSGRWKTVFTKANGDTYEAIGIFKQEGNRVTGTFLTALGDYRYLDGNVDGGQLLLSAFDGSHAYLFKAQLSEDGSMQGEFRSGPSYRESFAAEINETFELPDAYGMNFLKEGYEKLEFSFPDTDRNMVSLSDEKFKNKVVLIQLFGTWCPNCMDETRFLAPWYEKHKDKGIEIIALAFETKPDFDYASSRVKKSMEKMNAGYTFLIAGESNKEKASAALPALNQVIAFPTLIYLDKTGKVRKIHTGFNGPGTGAYYDRWVEEHESFVAELLKE